MKNTKGFPLFVKIGLIGIYSKKVALIYFWICIALAIICGILGFFNKKYLFGIAFILSAIWYYASIKWVDKNSEWEK